MIDTPVKLETMSDLQALVVSGFIDWKQFGAVYTKRMDDLILFNYTPEAIFANNWTFLERISRGLILNVNTGEIVARPFEKFFNWLEGGRMPEPGSQIVSVTEKLDGSLGILLRHQGQYRIATRGSFDGDQAQWATDFLNSGRFDLTLIPDFATLLFEIIYPQNRVVIDYGQREALVLLAIRNRFSGEYLSHHDVAFSAGAYGFDLPKVYSYEDIDKLLFMTPVIDHEGYVVEFSDGSRWKVKGEKYRQLHKIISRISFNAVLDAMAAGAYDTYRTAVPEEFLDEIDGYALEIASFVTKTDLSVRDGLTPERRDSFSTRKELALWVHQQPKELHRLFFSYYDDKYRTEDVYKLIPRRAQRLQTDRGEV